MSIRPTVVIADDHEAIRFGVRLALEDAGFEVLAAVADGPAAVRAAHALGPDLVVLDVQMPGGGIAAAAELRAAMSALRIVMLSGAAADDVVLAAVRAGADGYLLKSMDTRRLGAALHGVLAGEAAIPRELTARLLAGLRALDSPAEPAAPALSAREAEVLEGLRTGRTTAEIGLALGVSAITVRRHVSTLRRKLGARDRAELAALTPASAVRRPPPPGSGWPHAA